MFLRRILAFGCRPTRAMLTVDNLGKCATPHFTVMRHAGHAKWQNIAAQKKVSDGIRSSNAAMIVNKLQIAVRMGGSADPKKNTLIPPILEEAKKRDVGKSAAEFLAKRQVRGEMKEVETTLRGPNGTFIVVCGYTDRPKMFADAINAAKKKRLTGFTEDKSGKGLSSVFLERGQLSVPRLQGEDAPAMSVEQAEDLAIECGAEEIIADDQEDGSFIFVTALEDMFKVKSALEKQGVLVEGFERELVPIQTVQLPDTLLEAVQRGLTHLTENVPDIEKMYTNIDTLT